MTRTICRIACTVAVVVCFSASTLAQTPTVSQPATTVTVATQDWATSTFQDPQDMSQNTDLSWWVFSNDSPAHGWTSPTYGTCTGETSTRCFKATAATNEPNVYILETGNPGSAHLQRTGDRYPISGSTYRMVAVRMRLSGTQGVQRTPSADDCAVTGSTKQCSVLSFIWYPGTIYETSSVTSSGVANYGGWQIYLLDLSTLGAWPTSVGTLRFNPTFVKNDQVDIDWIRVVPNTATLGTIQWSGPASADIYLDGDQDRTNGNLGMIVRGDADVSKGVTTNIYTFRAGALAPGDYYPLVCTAGADPSAGACTYAPGKFSVNAQPTLTFTSPSEEGSSDDFATVQLTDPWDMASLLDIDYYQNIDNLSATTVTAETPAGTSLGAVNVIQGTSLATGAVGDPLLYPLWHMDNGRGRFTKIDSSRYHILTMEMGIPDKARDIDQGSIARLVWQIQGEEPNPNVGADIVVNHRAGVNVMDKIIADMKTLPVETDAGASPSTTGWSGYVEAFRLDPHEFDTPTTFYVKRIKLAANEKTVGQQYTIRWTYADESVAGTPTLTLYRDTDTNPASGLVQIATGIDPSATSSYTWDTTSLGFGTYYIYASFSDGTNTNTAYSRWPIVIDSSYNGELPRIVLNRRRLNFGGTDNGALRTSTQQIRVNITGTGGSTLQWVASSSDSRVQLSPISGMGNGTIDVTIASGPYADTFQGDWSITVQEALFGTTSNSRQTIRALFQMYPRTSLTAPSGAFDTPANGATGVTGSIAVTGWALDDIEIDRVEIWRDLVTGETTPPWSSPAGASDPRNGKVFIANGTFIEGSRPDIESGFPSMPWQYRGGWGYLLLTWGLWSQGNGTYTLHAYAFDKDGQYKLLGTKTISVANQTAVKPFGALDTPAYGETRSSSFYNYGWALTPNPNSADARSCTITNGNVYMSINSGTLVPVSYGDTRTDIANLFPGFSNGSNAGGSFLLDTTSMANGTYNIGWYVVDSCGRADGIGSRFFNVFNTGGSASIAKPSELRIADGNTVFPALGESRDALTAPEAKGAVQVGRSFKQPAERVAPSGGVRAVRLDQLDRLELRLPGGAAPDVRYEAYHVVGGELRQLPIGSSFDTRQGILYWQPAAAYLGAYDFVFLKKHNARSEQTVGVRVIVGREPASLFGTGPLVLSGNTEQHP